MLLERFLFGDENMNFFNFGHKHSSSQVNIFGIKIYEENGLLYLNGILCERTNPIEELPRQWSYVITLNAYHIKISSDTISINGNLYSIADFRKEH